jgi:hypothetical protein
MKILQVGCNDCNDHVKKFVIENQEKIELLLLIDINPKIIEYANIHYQNIVNYKTIVSAITPFEDHKSIKLYHTIKQMFSQHTSYKYDHMIKHLHMKEDIICVDHPATTINSILNNHNIETLDRLYIDTEGLDIDILNSIDYDKIKIKHIIFEHVHADIYKLKQYLQKMNSLGYKAQQSTTDILNTELFL